jgi:hypothetical protein
MAVNYESQVINGQLVPVPPGQAYDPLTYGQSLSGPGFWPAGTQYNLPPLLPSAVSAAGAASYNPGSPATVSQGTTAGAMSSSGKINWMSVTKSPALWVIGLLALALLMLHKVHYSKG